LTGNSVSVATHQLPTAHELPGDHVCAFYRGATERDQVMSAYVRDGLRVGHACLCVARDGTNADTLAALDGTDVSRFGGDGPAHPHGPGGVAVHDRMLRTIGDWSRATSERGDYSFARVVADMSWALPTGCPPSTADIADYEATATSWTSAYPQTVVCMYDLDRFGCVTLALIKAHPRVWVSGVVLDNPYAPGARWPLATRRT
jgi:hypothetical protein